MHLHDNNITMQCTHIIIMHVANKILFKKFVGFKFDHIIQIEAVLRQALRQANVTVSSRRIKTGEDPTTIDDLFVSVQS